MSERPIQVGDLVMVVRGHSCVLDLLLGRPWRVTDIRKQIGGGWVCGRCKTRDIAPEAMYGAAGHGISYRTPNSKPGGIPLQWLKRIPPLDELEGVKRDEEMVA
jgi:hypothetical protein